MGGGALQGPAIFGCHEQALLLILKGSHSSSEQDNKCSSPKCQNLSCSQIYFLTIRHLNFKYFYTTLIIQICTIIIHCYESLISYHYESINIPFIIFFQEQQSGPMGVGWELYKCREIFPKCLSRKSSVLN